MENFIFLTLRRLSERMDAKCQYCNHIWNISIKAKIPKAGYKCPICRLIERREKESSHNGKV